MWGCLEIKQELSHSLDFLSLLQNYLNTSQRLFDIWCKILEEKAELNFLGFRSGGTLKNNHQTCHPAHTR